MHQLLAVRGPAPQLEVLNEAAAEATGQPEVCWMPGTKRSRQTERQQGERVTSGGERFGTADLGRSEACCVRSA